HYGDNLKYGYQGQKYPINGTYENFLIRANTRNAYDGYLSLIQTKESIRENAIEEVQNINLGVKERLEPDISLMKDIDSIQVNVNGDTYVYRYGDRFNAALYSQYSKQNQSGYDMSPQVRYENKYGSMSYTRAVYASDIYYKDKPEKEQGKELSVKVTYKIGVKSSVDSLKSVVNEIEDYYDTKYFNTDQKIHIGKHVNKKGDIVSDELSYTKLASENTDYYKMRINQTDLELDGTKGEGIIYVQLEVKPEKIVEILSTDIKINNFAEIASYSIRDKQNRPYAGIDKDSQPGNMIVGKQSTYEDDTDKSPSLVIVLQEERKIEGKVFIDKTTGELRSGEIREGNGTYDEGQEVGVDGVKVELINLGTGKVDKVYHYEEEKQGEINRKAEGKWVLATDTTKNNGEYEIRGMLPDNYKLVFTWGGQTYVKENGEEQLIRVQDYKGTIYKDKDRQNNLEWYKTREPRYSDAMDNYDTREKIDTQATRITNRNKEVITKYQANQTIEIDDRGRTEVLIKQIDSNTPDFKVNVEYNGSEINHRDEYELNSDGNVKMDGIYVVKKEGQKNLLKNVDFGIVERAKQVLKLSKELINAKLVLADGKVLINAHIKDGKLQNEVKHTVYLPKSEGLNGVKMEIDNEILQGARLELTYQFKVKNISELDYKNKEYYTYGNGYGIDDDSLVRLGADTVIDYVDNNLTRDLNTKDDGWKACTAEEKVKLMEKGLLAENLRETLIQTNTVAQTQNLKQLLKPKGTTQETEVETTMKIYRILPSVLQEEDSTMENHAEIIKVIKTGGSTLVTTPGNYIPSEGVKEVDEAEAETVTITQPTGQTINYISYTLLAISSLGILVSGIILIKRWVLR
ncbi:MAG: hypothetical protein HFJ17_06165, partial [Clostridia bacterium]|nr:hypothetical protein [Clostridia bacterium]